jgi:hypothetical protein
MGKFTGITSTSTASDEERGPRRERVIEQVVFGTHGRLKNWVSKRILDVDSVCILVLDEADEMLKGDSFADDSGGDVALWGLAWFSTLRVTKEGEQSFGDEGVGSCHAACQGGGSAVGLSMIMKHSR